MSIQSGTSPGAIISAGNTPAAGGVTSVFGRSGAVVAVSGDYTSSQITNASAVVGATVTDALNTLLAADTGFVPTSRTLTAGAGLTGGGDLSANRTFDVVANADGSIIVNANDIQVGVLATDAQHGVRGGGTQHALVIAAGAAGFMSGADKTKLDGISPGAGVTSVFGRTGAVVAVNGDYTSSLVTNSSTVVGATVTDALNALNSTTPAATVDIYMATTGNDANPGTIASPVLTLAGAYSKIPVNATLPVIHVASGTYVWSPMPIALTIIGDGAGQGADTGFTTVATGVSAAGTTALQLTLAAPVAVNLYRGLTLEWRSGAANGHRSSIRDNTATVVTPVEVAGFPTSSINPGVGSSFAILRPSVIFTTVTAEISGSVEIADTLATSREYTPVALVNVRIVMSSATVRGMISAANVRMFGVEVNPGTFYLVDATVDGGYVLPESAMNAWSLRVGLTGFAQITNWIGWGVTWPAAVAADQSWFINANSLLRGMFVFGGLVPSTFEAGQNGTFFGNIEIMGGSALGDISLYGGTWVQSNFNILLNCRKFLASVQSNVQISGMLCDAALSGTPLTVEWQANVVVSGVVTLQNSSGIALIVTRSSRMFVRSFTTFSAIGSGSGQGILVAERSELTFSNLTTVTITGGDCALRVINQSNVFMDAGTFTITANNNLRQAIEISENSAVTFSNNGTMVANGRRGGALIESNSRLTIQSSTSSLTATVNGPGVQCSGGSSFYSPGGASHVVTGLGANGFGMNCRGGGQAFWLAAPTAVTGPLGDLTVGTGIGDTVANAALAVTFSSVVAGPSSVARSS